MIKDDCDKQDMITVMMTVMIIRLSMFFLSGFSSTDTLLHSTTLPIPLAHEH